MSAARDGQELPRDDPSPESTPGKRYGPGEELPSGYQKKTLLSMIIDELEAIGGTVIVILDEIDAIGSDDYILYELPRAEPDDVRLSIIGITNDLQFREGL